MSSAHRGLSPKPAILSGQHRVVTNTLPAIVSALRQDRLRSSCRDEKWRHASSLQRLCSTSNRRQGIITGAAAAASSPGEPQGQPLGDLQVPQHLEAEKQPLDKLKILSLGVMFFCSCSSCKHAMYLGRMYRDTRSDSPCNHALCHAPCTMHRYA